MSLRALTLGVTYLDDSSVHEQMVRFATAQLRSGHLPLTRWFPYLGLGSPQFLHYQSLPAMLTGALGLAIGADTAFRMTLYVLLSLWPVSVYNGARLFGPSRAAAGISAAMSPFLVSATGIGYEQHAYLWTGFGVWTQLWASMTLPLAWGFSWQAIRFGRHRFAAVALTSLTIALHFETGYLALIPLALWPLACGRRQLIAGARRAAVLIGGSLLASAWVIVPLIAQRSWAAVNEPLSGSPLANGYGLPRVLGWLASGQLLDHGRVPVLTLFAAIGLALTIAASIGRGADADARALLVALAVCLLLASGRTTFGPLAALIPGSRDIFFRRFTMGLQLVALLLAGRGAAACVRWRPPRLATTAAVAATIVVLAPAWLQLGAYDRHDATAIAAQRRADSTEGAELDQLLAIVQANGGGRVYAGMPTNWGMSFTVGAVPVFKYLESRDVDVVGYTLRTASLMTNPEYNFDEHNPSDYTLFGIAYLVLPSGQSPPIQARLVASDGPYALWRNAFGGYLHVGRVTGALNEDRTNIGARSVSLLHSGLPRGGDYLAVTFGGARGRRGSPSLPSGVTEQSEPSDPSETLAELDDLEDGTVTATIRTGNPATVVLSASFDPGWRATVDGHRQSTRMVAPALVAADVPAGTHTVTFGYVGYGGYAVLLTVSGLTLVALLGARLFARRRRVVGRALALSRGTSGNRRAARAGAE